MSGDAPVDPDAAGRRFPSSVYSVGEEPDPRFSLANERTFLAWMRTSLALIAAGVALEAFAVPLQPGFRLAASVLLLVLGVALPIVAWFGWMRTERALRLALPLPSPVAGGPVAVVVTIVGLVLLVGLLFAR